MVDLKDILKFEKDENGFPKLTRKNVQLINFIIENDSNYRFDMKDNYLGSTKKLVYNFKNNPNEETLREVIKAIDNQNSTHISVTGKKEGSQRDNQGISKILEICKVIGYEKLIQSIKKGDSTLVDQIADNKLIPNRYNISFASKFCTYLSRYMFDHDSYSIYDGVIANILPYYYYMYVQKVKENKTKQEKIKIKNANDNKIIKERHYKWYNDLILEILEMDDVKKEKISREDFDHLLWYYFKGDKSRKQYNYLSRIKRANNVLNEFIKEERRKNEK